ncbi:MAG TPA: hypothetical protein DCL54_06360, partial [Alphaproteobacteria bacterium]|nr:hypothetical protein [Alphaproteobacteria bacterium]
MGRTSPWQGRACGLHAAQGFGRRRIRLGSGPPITGADMARDGEGRTALITGASAGIGKALAEEFARNGFDVVLTARREGRMRELGAQLEQKYKIKAHIFTADLSDPVAPANLCQAFAARGLQIDALVNNAGYGLTGSYHASTWEAQRDFLQVLVTAPCAFAHLLLPGMQERRYGRI